MKKVIASVASVLALTQIAQAGSANGEVNCRSASGRTKVTINYPVDIGETSAKLTIDNSEFAVDTQAVSNWGDEDSSSSTRFQIKAVMGYDLENEPLYYVVSEDSGGKFPTIFLRIKEVKGTRKNKVFNGNKIEFNFAALLNGIDPRNSEPLETPIKLNCKFRFAL